MACLLCNTETSVYFFALCERCYAFETFRTHAPTAEEYNKATMKKACACNIGNDAGKQCTRCRLVRLYYLDFAGGIQQELFENITDGGGEIQ